MTPRFLLALSLAFPLAAQTPGQLPGRPASPGQVAAPGQVAVPGRVAAPGQPAPPGQAAPAAAPTKPAGPGQPASPGQPSGQPVSAAPRPTPIPPADPATGLPAPEALLDRYVEATGGQAAYEDRTSEVSHGVLEYPAQGLKGTITRYAAAPDLYYASLDIPGIGTIAMGVKDGIAWENSLVLGPRIKTGSERAEALREAKLNSTLLWRDLYSKVETIGTDTVNGEECYQVKMTPTEGEAQTMCFSKATGLGLKVETTAASQLGNVQVEITFSGYKNFGGILAPSKVYQKGAGIETTIEIQNIEVNPEIPDKQFELPAEVQVLLARQQKQKAQEAQ